MSEQPNEPQADEQVEGEPVEGAPETGEPSPEEAEGEESEEVEGVEGDEPAPDQPVNAQGFAGEKELEKMFKRVDTANAAYSKKLGEIMGDEAGVLEQCPRCSAPFLGFIFPPAMQQVDDDVKRAVLLSVGETPPQVTVADNFARRCENCDGWGRVLSGSRVNSQVSLSCIACKGRGWVPVGPERMTAAHTEQTGDVPMNGELEHEPAPDKDPWGRGPDHPDYGRMPQFVRG